MRFYYHENIVIFFYITFCELARCTWSDGYIGINNSEKKLLYQGSFWGDNSSIDPIDYELIARTRILGVKRAFEDIEFYNQLLIESFILLKEKKYKLSYFMTYSALENFVNTIMNSHDEETRFDDKLKELFKLHIPKFSKNQIYTSIIGELGSYTRNRNTIVHGKEHIEINHELADSFLGYILTLIALYVWKHNDFESLIEKLKSSIGA